MFKRYTLLFGIAAGLIVALIVLAEEPKYETQTAPNSLKHFINLEGEWLGKHIDHDGNEQQVNLVYRTVAGGTAVEERIFVDSPQEMITMYHGNGNDGLLMTHYCMLGNQPRLSLATTDGKVFDFQYLDGSGINREKTGHMGAMKMTILDKNTFEQEWMYYEEGKIKNKSKFTFIRK